MARALAADPPLLLLDEPFGALDPLTRASLQREFAALSQRLGKTAMVVTHDAGSIVTWRQNRVDGQLELVETPNGFVRSDNVRARAYLETLKVSDTL